MALSQKTGWPNFGDSGEERKSAAFLTERWLERRQFREGGM